MEESSHGGRAHAHEGVHHEVGGVSHREDEALDQFDRELAGVDGLLDVVVFDVRDEPKVAGVFPLRVARVLADLRSLVVALARVLLGNPDRVEIEDVVIALGEPQDGFVAA